jgi:hypothetical protein
LCLWSECCFAWKAIARIALLLSREQQRRSAAGALVLREWDLGGGLAGLRVRLGLRPPLIDSLRLSERTSRIVVAASTALAGLGTVAAAASTPVVLAERIIYFG